MGKRLVKKIENLDKLTQLLLSYPQGLRKAEIARRLDVHRSTAAEYLDDLTMMGVPVYEPTKHQFSINRAIYQFDISLTLHESMALHLASRLLATRTDKHNPHAASSIRKLGIALEELAPLISKHLLLSAKTLESPIKRRDPIYLQALETLTKAWALGKKVHLTHELPDGKVYDYTFSPYFIEPYAIGRTSHVIGFREPPSEIRTFKIERIRTIELLEEEAYSIPDDFDPSDQLRDAWGIWFAEDQTTTVKLKFNKTVAKRVQETQWHHSQNLRELEDGSLLWITKIAEPQEMEPWIRGWGPDVEVLEPIHLRERVSADAQKLTEIYDAKLKKEFIAHVREKDGEIQSLWEHLTGVSVIAGQFADKVGMKEIGEVLGLLHDLGKASQEFQNYIRSGEGLINPDADEWVDSKAKKGKIDHSSAGAQILYRKFYEKGKQGQVTAQALSLCIASHHSGLIDCLTPDGENNFKRRIEKSDKQTHVNEAWSNIDEIDKKLCKLLSQNLEDKFISSLKNLKEDRESYETFGFKQGLLIRYLLSCLIDADRLDTADFDFPPNERIRNYGQYRSWITLIQRLDDKLGDFEHKEKRNEIDKLRNQVSQECLDYSSKPQGVYQLTVPTGGGKTFSSLRFALNHAKHHNMDRVFYIIPYTSIIDQNANEVRKILEDKDENGEYLDKVVLEHHSNLTPEEESYRQKLLSDNWDAPIVFTTQVQFLEALFGSGTRSVRRMHQLANSVIIFDEIQTIPVRTVHMFNTALKFFVHSCGSTIVLCTATQPLLDKVEPNSRALPIDGKIIQNEKELYNKLKRVKVFDKRKVGGWNDDEVSELAVQELQEKGSVLIVANTKKSALSLYQSITDRGDSDAYHLSTNMCPAHRLEVLEKIKAKLDAEEPVICVSTQLIEAGVDIDFGSVIRYLAGLDSIIQAAGRCNRNGKQKDFGNVWIVNPEREHIDRLRDIRVGVKIAERILGEFDVDPKAFDDNRLGLEAMERYYKYYFYNRKNEMDYNILKSSLIGREDNLFNLLSQNTMAARRSDEKTESTPPFRQSFQSASRIFQAIDSPTRGVIVPYGKDGEEIVNALCSIADLNKQFKLIKKAQRYSVNLYPHEFYHLLNDGAIREVQEGTGVYYLDYQYYSKEFGWSKGIVTEMKTQIV